MKPIIIILAVLCCPVFAFCQDITGLWKGTMYNDSTHQSLDYEIVISKQKGKLIGYSHTSYLVGNTKYYGVKKINVRVAKDGKIVMQDAKWLENNYPGEKTKNVIQLNVLDLAKSGEESYMDGLFVTNQSKSYNALTGRMSIKKVNSQVAQSELMKYLQLNAADDDLTVFK
jgi:hypothetical protein